MRSANPTARDLRRINRQTVFQYLYTKGMMSRLELSHLSGLSAGTIANVVSELLAEDLVLEAGFEASEGGRPRTLLTLNRAYGYFIGGEIGETEIIIVLYDVTLHPLQKTRLALCEHETNPEVIAQSFVRCIRQLITEQGIAQEKLLGIGIGVPGVVRQASEETVSAPAWNWRPVPLKAMLQRELDRPLHVDNGCKTMALAEMHLEPGARHETLAALNIGTGVGAGIVYEEKLYRGGNNSAGEWGHTLMVLGGEQCRCGSYGCLEAYIGAPGIIRRLRTLSPASPALDHGTEECIIAAIIQAAIQGEPAAHEIMQATSHYLGAGIANLINLFNPQRIILGGKIGLLLGRAYLPEITRQARRYALKEPFEATGITVSSLGEDAASLGAARLALEDFLIQVGGPAKATRLIVG